jgi:hypothetical protein
MRESAFESTSVLFFLLFLQRRLLRRRRRLRRLRRLLLLVFVLLRLLLLLEAVVTHGTNLAQKAAARIFVYGVIFFAKDLTCAPCPLSCNFSEASSCITHLAARKGARRAERSDVAP